MVTTTAEVVFAMPLLGSTIQSARARSLVGGRALRASFDDIITGDLPTHVLYLHGVGGIGKSTVIAWFEQRCRDAGHAVTVLHPGEAVGGPVALDATSDRIVVIVDVNGRLGDVAGLDPWLRDTLIPALPAEALLVIGTRSPPGPAWQGDPGLAAVTRFLEVPTWTASEVNEYLAGTAVAPRKWEAVHELTCGHPLALAMAGTNPDTPAGHGDPGTRSADGSVDVAVAVSEWLIDGEPTTLQRAALDLVGLVREITEDLLRATFEPDEAAALFRWLQSQSFMSPAPVGLVAHPVAREMFDRTLRWRDPDRYQQLHDRIREHLLTRLESAGGAEAERLIVDLADLHRGNPVIHPFVCTTPNRLTTGSLDAGDIDDVLAVVERHEGQESRALAAALLRSHADDVVVARGLDDAVAGFAMVVPLPPRAEGEVADPALACARLHLDQRRRPRAANGALYVRYWMGVGSYQAVTPTQTLLFASVARRLHSHERLEYTFVAVADPARWAPAFEYLDFVPAADAAFEVDGHTYGVFARDWHASSRAAWLAQLRTRETWTRPSWVIPNQHSTEQGLTESEVRQATLDALRNLDRPLALQDNALLRSRTIEQQVDASASTQDRVDALQTLIRDVIEEIGNAPRDVKLRRALHHTHVQPGATQESVAELLGLPFSTYRRHLTAGRQLVADQVWLLERGHP